MGRKKMCLKKIAGIAFIVFLVRGIFYKNVVIGQLFPDSGSYINYNLDSFLSGFRMPLYPFIIQLMKVLLGENYFLGVVLFQILISLIGVFIFGKTIYLVTKNRTVTSLLTVMWGCYPGVMSFDTIILTESLAISVSIFLLYFSVLYIKTLNVKAGIAMIVSGFCATLIKTALFVYTFDIIALLLFMMLMNEKERRKNAELLCISVGIVVVYLLYAYQVYLHAGVFSMGRLGPGHTLAKCLSTGLYENYYDKSTVELIKKIYVESGYSLSWTTLTPIMELFGNDMREINMRVKEFNSYCIKTDISRYIKCIGDIIINNMSTVYSHGYNEMAYENDIYRYFINLQEVVFSEVKFGHVYLIGIFSTVMAIVNQIKRRTMFWYYLGTAGIIFSIVLSVFVGTYSEFMRCTVYVLPFAYFGIALLINELFKIQNRRVLKSELEIEKPF